MVVGDPDVSILTGIADAAVDYESSLVVVFLDVSRFKDVPRIVHAFGVDVVGRLDGRGFGPKCGQCRPRYRKHASDFTVRGETDYELKASAFLITPIDPGIVFECTRPKGDTVRYSRATEEYGVMDSRGIIRTYFKPKPCASLPVGSPRRGCHNKPDNETYFREECKRTW